MNDQSMLPQTGPSERRHPAAVQAVTTRILRLSPARGRDITVGAGRRVRVIEAGEGPPIVLLHGTSTSSLLLLPLLERLEGVRAIAVDRPGFGLSDPAGVPPERFRTGAVEFLDEVLDQLQLETAALAGSSMGGTWALWYALARPDRLRGLVLLGAAPLLPGTRVPPPLRVLATPVVGELLQRLTNPSPKLVVWMMASMGEKDTIINYPDQIQALVAGGNDPVMSQVNLAELRTTTSPMGLRRSLRVRPDELRQLSVPTLLVWGDHDPVGAVTVAQATANLIPNAHLEVLPAGHGPWLGNPDRTAELVSRFVG
ncbi:MAG TPA: alpha/beta hydrolase [Actinomycetes bacterium]|jgi:pimeloyl-ACP methyl ester carboxylesterase|nr:alpha/beta hydrolase [Actinomycetes bacterium]